jgi:hypothetical protein
MKSLKIFSERSNRFPRLSEIRAARAPIFFALHNYSPSDRTNSMRDTSTMIQDDTIKAKSILKHIQGCKVADDQNNQYEVVDVKVFNGSVSFIGLKDDNGVIKYASENCYMSMADVA